MWVGKTWATTLMCVFFFGVLGYHLVYILFLTSFKFSKFILNLLINFSQPYWWFVLLILSGKVQRVAAKSPSFLKLHIAHIAEMYVNEYFKSFIASHCVSITLESLVSIHYLQLIRITLILLLCVRERLF
jgi:hypothetical protein